MNLKLPDNLSWLRNRVIYMTQTGSRAYGTATPHSDYDIRGIAIPPLSYFFGQDKNFTSFVTQEVTDLTIYDIRRFITLAADANPNMLEILFTDPSDYLMVHPIASTLLKNRDKFLSQRIAFTYTGAAISQLRKVERTRANPDSVTSPERRATIQTFGYDTKEAMHIVRWLRMAKESLAGHGLQVRRPDAQELLFIRNGSLSFDTFQNLVKSLEREVNEVALPRSPLPETVDRLALDELCCQLVQASFEFHVHMPMVGKFQSAPMQFSQGSLHEKKLSGS